MFYLPRLLHGMQKVMTLTYYPVEDVVEMTRNHLSPIS